MPGGIFKQLLHWHYYNFLNVTVFFQNSCFWLHWAFNVWLAAHDSYIDNLPTVNLFQIHLTLAVSKIWLVYYLRRPPASQPKQFARDPAYIMTTFCDVFCSFWNLWVIFRGTSSGRAHNIFSEGKAKFGSKVYAPSPVIGQQLGFFNKVSQSMTFGAHFFIKKYCTKHFS
jgi:hypothetical protein